MFENVLIGQYNQPNPNKRIINITKEKLESLLVNSEYYLLQDMKGPSIDILKNIKGVCRNLKVEEENGIVKLYADIKIIDPFAQNIHPLDCTFSMRMVGKPLGYDETLDGNVIDKIVGWDIKYNIGVYNENI